MSGLAKTDATVPFTIVIPTINSARWIARMHAYYRALGVTPLFIVDSRTDDATVEILRRDHAAYVILENTAPIVEGFVFKFRDVVTTDWILRLDDDECPSAELLWWLGQRADTGDDAIGFIMRWLRLTPAGGLEYLANRSWHWRWRHVRSDRGEDRKFRLWHKDRVHYVTHIHSPGFDHDSATHAPDSCVMYHLCWILRSEAERAARSLRYDAQRPGAGADYDKYYLPERVPHWDFRGAVHDPLVLSLARALDAVSLASLPAEC